MALPAVIQEIIQLIGHAKAMALVREFGGQELRIPRSEMGDTWAALAEVIGEKAMAILANSFGGGDPLYIALCHLALKQDRNREMIARYEHLLKQGHSGRGAVSVLVREYGPISYRQVEKVVNSPLPAPSAVVEQGQLF